MKFHRTEPNSHYRSLRLVSRETRWDLGMSPYTHGIRMRMGPHGRPPTVMDFCMGEDGSLYPRILMAILGRLEHAAEDASPGDIDALFPWKGTRADLSLHLRALLAEAHSHSFGSTW